jgi:hypothetical protein
MKGNISIEIKETNNCGSFPITNIIKIERDNTFEGIDEWIDVFKKILYIQGFHPNTITEVFPEEV